MKRIAGQPDELIDKKGRVFKYLGRKWSDSVRSELNNATGKFDRNYVIDLVDVDFIAMFEWVTTLATVDKIMASLYTKSFSINFLGSDPIYVPTPREYIGILKNGQEIVRNKDVSEINFGEIDRLYRLCGFLESLGTQQLLNRPTNNTQLHYQWINDNDARTRSFHSSKGKQRKPTTLLGLTIIESKEHCKNFLDDQQIKGWRGAMEERFRSSPLIQSDEIWRVIFHELAVNIWEHSGESGIVGSRVVSPFLKQEVKDIWKNVYPDISDEKWSMFRNGLLEVCVADAGLGLVNTLKDSFIEKCEYNQTDYVSDEKIDHHILVFAFDELGTSKQCDESWITERHALGRTLNIICKYGGLLTIRSGTAEVTYVTRGGMFERLPGHFGYKPTYVRELAEKVVGTQIQILLPLFPQTISSRIKNKNSVLEYSLPGSFKTDLQHPRGHLVPIFETFGGSTAAVGGEDAVIFKKEAIVLCQLLAEKRAPLEPIVFDFSNTKWTAAQLETFLYYLQNIIQNRPSLIVEIDKQLAMEVKDLVYSGENTLLKKEILKGDQQESDSKYYDEVSEKRFLETYKGVYSILLAIDKNGRKHIFALSNPLHEELLIDLIEFPDTIKNICEKLKWKGRVSRVDIELILHNINQLYQADDDGVWHCAWSPQELYIEMNRVMSLHFNEVAERSHAWKGKSLRNTVKKSQDLAVYEALSPIRFNLSWQREWRKDFLECSQILSRERYADEAAQRLLFRLKSGLILIDKSIENVKVLACPTGPSMMLAASIHSWWPSVNKPIVADMSYYTLLSSSEKLPKILLGGDVVIVQDVLDKGTISGKLIKLLQELKSNVICVIGLLRLVNNKFQRHDGTRITNLSDGWELSESDRLNGMVPSHAMLEVKGPEVCQPLQPNQNDHNSYWIEPRALYPIKYTSLRREFAPGQDTDLERRNKLLEIFDSPTTGCLFAAGHYVYGHRHYAVAVNVRSALEGHVGERIAKWLAEVCLGDKARRKAEWEKDENEKFQGGVTAVLMPLHSQIHYLWPRVANILSQCGRRQPVWLLDATLFTGSGASYRLPVQLKNQIEVAVKESINVKTTNNYRNFKPLKIFIIDDAITSGRTAETILGAITHLINEMFDRLLLKKTDLTSKSDCPNPVDWIRYFAVFSQVGYARHLLWKNINNLDGITFKVEEFAPFMGVPVYDEKNCPICRDRRRLRRLISKCGQLGAIHARNWAEHLLEESFPVAIDSPWGEEETPERVRGGIDILGVGKGKREDKIPLHTNTAIWEFHEYMYLSYPIGDFLVQILNSWKESDGGNHEKIALVFPESYRWTVFEWCLRNWARVEAATAKVLFLECINKELENNTTLLERILESSTQHYSDESIKKIIKNCIVKFASEERKYQEDNTDESAILYLKRLEIGLTAFFLNIPKHALADTYSPEKDSDLVDEIYVQSSNLGKKGPSFINNLYARLNRPRQIARPDWTLNVMAESLLRGRNPDNQKRGGHHLLPGLVGRVLSSCRYGDWLLLQGSVSLFLAALDNLSPYTILDPSLHDDSTTITEEVRTHCNALLEWYTNYPNYEKAKYNLPRALSCLDDLLSFAGPFIEKFHNVFHEKVSFYKEFLEERVLELSSTGLLDFNFDYGEKILACRCLAPVQRLSICLANLAIDHIAKCSTNHSTKIICFRSSSNGEVEKIIFRILTSFGTPEETNTALISSVHSGGERNILKSFGVKFDDSWQKPDLKEVENGFKAVFNIKVPSGYLPRRQNK